MKKKIKKSLKLHTWLLALLGLAMSGAYAAQSVGVAIVFSIIIILNTGTIFLLIEQL